MEDSALSETFINLSLQNNVNPSLKSLVSTKGRNPSATEFVPKFNSGLTHSSSSPSFNNLSLGGHSPSPSPGLSPQNSPLMMRHTKSPHHTSTPTSNQVPITQTNHSINDNSVDENLFLTESVGGTTYFYHQDELADSQSNQNSISSVIIPNFTHYQGMMPHVAHMKLKSNMPLFFMPDELKLELLNRNAFTMAQVDREQTPDIPQEIDNYHSLFPLEPPPPSPMHKSNTFGYPTSCYKAVNVRDGLSYCLRRIHGFRLASTQCMGLIDLWKKIQHSNIVQLKEVFTTKAFGDYSMVFVYDFHPLSETLMSRHFLNNQSNLNGYSSPYNVNGAARPYSAGKANGPRQQAGLLSESLIWSYIVQLSSALRTIHSQNLACRVMDPTKILLTDKSRIRLNCVGIFDVLSFDSSQSNTSTMMPHYQQEDLVSMGKVILALACNSVIGIQRQHLQTSMDLVSRNYSSDLKNLILYLLMSQTRIRTVNDIMPMIGARFYTQLDASQLRSDIIENELAKEIENGRLFRMSCKLGIINERSELNMDPSWAETGDRYMLKLFRDYLFHQVNESGHPWIDMAHIVQCLNKMDSGSNEKLCLTSRDEQSVIIVTYSELKHCFESAIKELLESESYQSNFS